MRAPAFWWRRPGWQAAMLAPLSAVYGAVAASRLRGDGMRASVPVICVGNPTVGGAGKTPTAIAVARLLAEAARPPAFLTRGYGGRLPGPVRVAPGHTAVDVGDEPLLLAQVAPTIVARDRAAGARAAEALGADVLVMDDGFQNPSLAKDLVLLVVDGQRGLGNGRVLPAGPLRAPLAPQLDRAHALVVMGDIAAAAEEVVEMAVKRGLPVLAARLQPEAAAVAALSRKPLLAYSGIGDPRRFLATLATAALDVRASRAFGDHHCYTPIDAQRLLADADLLRLDLVTTEKDLARLEGGKRLDRDDGGSNRSDVMNVIDSNRLERDDREHPVPAFSHPALAELARRSRALPVRTVFADEAALRRLVLNALAAARGA